ncbi:MAG: hypothetical protein KDK76_03585 [Chlamydiia bacterium]|nr:hypothetical protein [Chlamydiia bacterium]
MAAVPPPPVTQSQEPRQETGISSQDQDAASLWGSLWAVTSRATNYVARIYINSLDTVVWTKFDHSLTYNAPIPPWYLTSAQRATCNPKTINVFCRVMENYRAAERKNPHLLSYTQYSNALEGEDFNQQCHDALAQSILQWIGDREVVQVGIPHDQMREGRPSLSHDFLRAFLPFLPRFNEVTFSGPIDEKSRPLIKHALQTTQHVARVRFELERESAEYFLSALPDLVQNHIITEITFRHTDKKEEFAPVLTETWQTLLAQHNCAITFRNVPAPQDAFLNQYPNNGLTFN